jgi:hypothetical protein
MIRSLGSQKKGEPVILHGSVAATIMKPVIEITRRES